MVEQANVNGTDVAAAVETKVCPICGRDIEVSKFRLHEVACARMNYKCPKCGEIVPKADREHHDENECSARPKPKVEEPVVKPQMP